MQLTADFPVSYGAFTEDWATAEPDVRVTAPGGGGRELRVTVCPDGRESWVGAFAASRPGVRSLSALLATPDPDALLVLERGTAFLGSVHSPQSFRLIGAGDTVCGAVPLPEESLLLLVGHVRIVAVGEAGVRWVSGDLSMDGEVTVGVVADGRIHGVADTGDYATPFTLDLATGERLPCGG